MRFLSLALLSSVAASVSAAPAASDGATKSAVPLSAPITQVHVFGDSYTDSCNTLRANGGYRYPTCPPPPQGRADGGRSWPEWIRIDQGQVERPGSPPGGSPKVANSTSQWNIDDWAWSGATCDNAVFPRPGIPDVNDQIGLMTTKFNTTPAFTRIDTDPAKTLAVIFIGTNDIAIMAGQKLGTPDAEVNCILTRMKRLYSLGLRRFAIVQNIDLQDAPYYLALNQTARLVDETNRFQLQRLTPSSAVGRGASVDVFPTYSVFKAMHDLGSAYGFTNTRDACNGCADESKYLWHDTIHPTSRAEHIFARKFVRWVRGARGASLVAGTEGV